MGPLGSSDIVSGKQALERAFDTLSESAQTCREQFDRIVGQVVDHRAVLAPMMPLVRDRLDEVRGYLQQELDRAERVIEGGSEVLRLFTTSIDYLTAVQAPLSDLSYDIEPPLDEDLQRWTGPAAAAYRRHQAAQKAAALRAAEHAAQLSRWLSDIGRTNVAYATQVVRILVDVAGRLLEVSAAGVLDLPFSLARLPSSIARILADGAQRLAEPADRFAATLDAGRAMLARVESAGEFPGGRWPRAVPPA